MTAARCTPDLSARPLALTIERAMIAPPDALFRAWTAGFDRWFAAPGTVSMRPEVNAPFFFEVRAGGARFPHYGRFLRLEHDRRVEMTWVTGEGGTGGAETVVTVEFAPQGAGTALRLGQAGFLHEGARDAHAAAWPMVLGELDRRLTEGAGEE